MPREHKIKRVYDVKRHSCGFVDHDKRVVTAYQYRGCYIMFGDNVKGKRVFYIKTVKNHEGKPIRMMNLYSALRNKYYLKFNVLLNDIDRHYDATPNSVDFLARD